MKSKSLKIPVIILSFGLILMLATYLLTSIRQKPTVTEQDFAYSVTYKIDGETKTLEGVYTCRFDGFGANGIDPLTRYYTEEYTVDGVTTPAPQHIVSEKGGYTLELITRLNSDYLMGEEGDYSELSVPHFEAEDAEGNQYDEENLPAVFDAEILSAQYPEPIENSFTFAGFSGLYVVNTSAILLAGLFTLLLCMILVRKADGVAYSALDWVGAVLNFIVILAVLPVIYLAACLIQAYPTGPNWIYQGYLCLPPILPLSVAASVALRRKGFRRSGFFIQFLGLAILVIFSALEYVL